MEKAFEIQKRARDNAKTFRTYLTDLQNWEVEMKRKEAALNGELVQELPPVRSKIKKEKPKQIKKDRGKRIKASDYQAWEKFDVEKACEDIDMEDVGPVSLDSKKSEQVKLEKLKEEALYEKERGNAFVKQEKWDEAIACYNRAIELVKDDAIYYANRGLCYLKKDSLHQAEADCSEALRLDATYVKALQRRAAARERLGSLRAASRDLAAVLRLEPRNVAARQQLDAIRARMGTKGSKSKSSPLSTPTVESRTIADKPKPEPKISEIEDRIVQKTELSPIEKWKDGVGENITVIKPVKKPPHLRSKRPLKLIPIQEILLGKSAPEKSATQLKIIEVEDNLSQGDKNNNSNIINNKSNHKVNATGEGNKQNILSSPESEKLVTEALISEKNVRKEQMVPPVNSVQFMSEWKCLKNNIDARGDYLSIIDPTKLPSIFENALESDVLSEVICTLSHDMLKFRVKTITAYLKGLSKVKRFSALAMFLTTSDKELLKNLLNHCKTVEGCSDNEVADLKNKYEL